MRKIKYFIYLFFLLTFISCHPQQDRIVKGTVEINTYPGGEILIFAVDKPDRPRTILSKVGIMQPGPFKLRIPMDTREFYISSFIDVNMDRNRQKEEITLISKHFKWQPIDAKTAEEYGITLIPSKDKELLL